MKKLFLVTLFLLSAHLSNVQAKEAFAGPNFSGVYACKGQNSKVGEYEVVATLKLNKAASHGEFGVYDFNTATENALVYRGQAIARGYEMAMTFNLTDGRTGDYSTGIASVQKISNTRWAYKNHYYEPDENGGDSGSEYCVMQKVVKTAKLPKKIKKPTVSSPSLS